MNRVPRYETLTYLTALALIAVIGWGTIKVIEERQGLRAYHGRVEVAQLRVLPEFRGKNHDHRTRPTPNPPVRHRVRLAAGAL